VHAETKKLKVGVWGEFFDLFNFGRQDTIPTYDHSLSLR
jgi:hypothetical protein